MLSAFSSPTHLETAVQSQQVICKYEKCSPKTPCPLLHFSICLAVHTNYPVYISTLQAPTKILQPWRYGAIHLTQQFVAHSHKRVENLNVVQIKVIKRFHLARLQGTMRIQKRGINEYVVHYLITDFGPELAK